MKANRAKAIVQLNAAVDKIADGGKSFEDKRFWAPTVDKAGNGYAVIRFLPAPKGEELPWVRYFDHGFKGPTGKWYIENSLTSIGQQDYVGEQNSALWNTGVKENQDIVRSRKRRLHYVANIEVISDPAVPANDGKRFLYKFGKKIFDKCLDLMQPEFKDESPVNPFDFWEGADFKIKIRQVEGYRNYDKSEFTKPAPHHGGDEKILEEVYNGLYSLTEFLDPKNYKSYDELKKKYEDVMNAVAPASNPAPQTGAPQGKTAEAAEIKYAPAPSPAASKPAAEVSSAPVGGEDEENTLSYFSKLARQE